ncbi:MAG TPA: hypothetical protein PKK06_03860 [Phycisphaerae bacterium]|nr:hypothetical protein [Phycisphaerae bacterium]HNU44923.1 hypothetical protein [Phycisphaerae bacterium]
MTDLDPVANLRDATGHPVPGHAPAARRQWWMGALLVYLVLLGLNEANLWRPRVVFGGLENVQIWEAQAWWQGRCDLPQREWDTSEYQGRVYSYFPPLFTMVATLIVPWGNGVPHWCIVLLALPLPLLAYALFARLTGSELHAVLLTVGLFAGTSAWQATRKAIQTCAPYHINHMLALVGVLLFVHAYLGKGRLGLAGVGLAVASWSRQLTLAYALPFFYLAWAGAPAGRRWSRLAMAGACTAVIVALPLVLNTLKFSNPLEDGYLLNYEGRDDQFAQDARTYGLFSTHYVPRNLYWTNLGFWELHEIKVAGRPEVHWRPSTMGVGLWWTSPLLLWLFPCLPALLRDPKKRVLLAAVVVIYVALLLWHGTGSTQRGYNRYSLDYVPVLMALITPVCVTRWRGWVSAGLIVWSVVYFRFLL